MQENVRFLCNKVQENAFFYPAKLRENVIMSLFQYEKQVKKGAGYGGRVR